MVDHGDERRRTRRPTTIRRPADSDDGARQPAESQRSGHMAGVPQLVAGDCCCRAIGVAARCCTSRQSDTHRIESREVRYPWHPWYGRAVWIDQVVVRGGRAVFRCRLEPGQEPRSVEVPQWMFDAAGCHRMRLGPIPSVSCDVLRDLQAVLSQHPARGSGRSARRSAPGRTRPRRC